jgi:RHS repeat-associated protein
VHTISGTSTQKDYCANVVYENGVQKMLLTEEGYVDLSNNTYYYYLKDHQGNNRVVLSSSGTVAEVNHYYPFGGVFASSGNMQPYKYNGKELDTKKGLNWYDYGARHYDATLGRWFVVDPLAEKYYSSSPFAYCGNNPIKYIDFNGMSYDGYTIDENGLMERVNDEGHNLYDVIYNKKNYSSENRLDYDISGNKTGIKINKGIVKRNVNESRNISNNYAHRGVKFQEQDSEGYPTGKEISVHVYEVANDTESLAIMNFMDKNTNIEWSNTLIEKGDGKYRNLLITSHEDNKVSGNTYLIDKFLQKTGGIVVRADHIHPRNTTSQHSDGDRQSAGTILEKSPNAKFRILFNGKYYNY